MDNRRDETDFSDHNTTAGVISQRAAMLAAVAWTAFVVYGSLLPFNYTAQPLALALEQFQHLRLMHIGPDGRADWMANLLLYVPLAFFWLAACDRPLSGPWRILGSSLVLTALCMLAAIIEFGQIFFPPRTVSLNDVIAEWLGISIGAAVWFAWGGHTRAIVLGLVRGGRGAVAPLVIVYAVAYVSLALFPFDFLLTPAEFSQKDPAQMGWWLAPRGCVRATQCAIQLAAEVAFAMPLGMAFVLTRRVAPQRVAMMLVLFGVLVGAAIELAQLLLASGVSQGASVAAKTSGFVAGGLLAPYCITLRVGFDERGCAPLERSDTTF